MNFLLCGIFGFLISACGINIFESPIKSIVLIVFFSVSIEIMRSRK